MNIALSELADIERLHNNVIMSMHRGMILRRNPPKGACAKTYVDAIDRAMADEQQAKSNFHAKMLALRERAHAEAAITAAA